MWDYGLTTSNNHDKNINLLKERLKFVSAEAKKIDSENEILKLLLRIPHTHTFVLYCEKTDKYYQNTYKEVPLYFIKIEVESLKKTLGV